jgi:hydroxymethylbilane synthase
MKLRLGTRASALARWQAEWVAARLRELAHEVELVPISTAGDRQRQGPIDRIGAPGVFTKEIQRALLDDRIDLAVHSLKDLSTERVSGLCLAAVPERGPAGDVFLSPRYSGLEALPSRAVIGTGSMRRKTQLWHARPDLEIHDIRGNVETRVAKLDAGDYDAIVLAEAGLVRLGLADRITQFLPDAIILPAVGQGALGLETRDDDIAVRGAIAPLDHRATHAAVLAERAMLVALQGGCLAPIGGWARVENGELTLRGRVLAIDGRECLNAMLAGSLDDAQKLGTDVAEQLLQQGAAELIRAARR